MRVDDGLQVGGLRATAIIYYNISHGIKCAVIYHSIL